MPTIDLDDDELALVLAIVTNSLRSERYKFSQRATLLRNARTKLQAASDAAPPATPPRT
jgi:hypothetical protein